MRLENFLSGVRIIDLSPYIPGPFATLTLADMGADVVKVEPPGGDPMRQLGPRNAAGEPVFHRALNAGKTILELDLKQDANRAGLAELLADADVLVEGFRPGVIERLGITAAWLEGINPRLIRCSLSGYGADGAFARRPGHDGNYLAATGAMYRNGPTPFDPPIADYAAALYAAIAILGALHGRQRSGTGCHIDIGLADAALALQLLPIAGLGATGTTPGRGEYYLNGGAAGYAGYATHGGGQVFVGALEPKFWTAFCRAAGKPDWIGRHDEPMPQTALLATLADFFAGHDTTEIAAMFADPECCVTVLERLDAALAQPHFIERGLVRAAPEGDLQALFPAKIDSTPPQSRPAPRSDT